MKELGKAKEAFRERLKNRPKGCKPKTPPPYNKLFYKGLAWLNKLKENPHAT